MSQADPFTPHGKKLYHLYVSDPQGYVAAVVGAAPAPVGLTLIKEAHHVLEGIGAHGPTGTRIVRRPGAISELFIMSKVADQDEAGTDAGWIYGVATPDGQIYANGLIESCIGCHEKADHDRLFGLAPATTIYFEDFEP